MEIIRDLFDGTVHYNNTGKRDLINNGVLTDCIELQRYLMALSSTLDIGQWVKQQTESKDRVRYGPISKAIVCRLRQELRRITQCQPEDPPAVSSPNGSLSTRSSTKTQCQTNQLQRNAVNDHVHHSTVHHRNEPNQQISYRSSSLNRLSGLGNAFRDPDDDVNRQRMMSLTIYLFHKVTTLYVTAVSVILFRFHSQNVHCKRPMYVISYRRCCHCRINSK